MIKLVWVQAADYRKFRKDNPDARLVSWPYSLIDENKFGFYVKSFTS